MRDREVVGKACDPAGIQNSSSWKDEQEQLGQLIKNSKICVREPSESLSTALFFVLMVLRREINEINLCLCLTILH